MAGRRGREAIRMGGVHTRGSSLDSCCRRSRHSRRSPCCHCRSCRCRHRDCHCCHRCSRCCRHSCHCRHCHRCGCCHHHCLGMSMTLFPPSQTKDSILVDNEWVLTHVLRNPLVLRTLADSIHCARPGPARGLPSDADTPWPTGAACPGTDGHPRAKASLSKGEGMRACLADFAVGAFDFQH